MLDKVRDTHGDTNEQIDPPQDSSLVLCRKLVKATSFMKDPGRIIHMSVAGPLGVLLIIMLDMVDHMAVFVIHRGY